MPREHTPCPSPLGKIPWTYQMPHLKGQVNPTLVWLPWPGGICWIYWKDQSDWFFHFSNKLPDTCYHQFSSCLFSLPSLFGCSVSEVQHGVVLPLRLLCFQQTPWKKPLDSSWHSPPCQCWSLLLGLNGWAVSYNCEKSQFNKLCIILALAHETCTRPTKQMGGMLFSWWF